MSTMRGLAVLLLTTILYHRGNSLKMPHDHGESVPVTIRPIVATGQSHIYLEQSFAPRFNLTYCTVYTDGDPDQLDCITVFHEAYAYIDLEQYEPLLVNQRVLCDERAVMNLETNVVLLFKDLQAMPLAHAQWGPGGDLIFVLEDPHCFQSSGDRSFYSSRHITWDFLNRKATIQALPLQARMGSKSEFAHRLTRGTLSLSALVSTGYAPFVRPGFDLETDGNHEIMTRQASGNANTDALQWQCIDGHLIKGTGSAGKDWTPCATGDYFDVDLSTGAKVILSGLIGAIFSMAWAPLVAAVSLFTMPTSIDFQASLHHDYSDMNKQFPLAMFDKKDESGKHIRIPHLTLKCPGCHVIGKFKGGLRLEFDLLGKAHKGPEICKNNNKEMYDPKKRNLIAESKLDDEMWYELERLASHSNRSRTEAYGLSERNTRTIHHDLHFKRGECGPDHWFYPHCDLADEMMDYHVLCDKYLDTILKHPVQIVLKAARCILLSVGGHSECWVEFVESAERFDDFEDWIMKTVLQHIKEAKFYFRVEEAIDIHLQPQTLINITAGAWFDIDFGIQSAFGAPPVYSWGWSSQLGPSTSTIYQQKGNKLNKLGKENSKKQKGWGSKNFGLGKMAWALPAWRLEFTISASLNAAVNFPGFKAQVSPGSLEIDLLHPPEDVVQSNLAVDLKYLEGNVDIADDFSVVITASTGPAIDFQLTPHGLGDENGDWQHNFLSSPLAFGGMFEMVRLDWKLGGAPANDPECLEVESAWPKNGGKTTLIFRTGLRLYGSLFGVRISTDWIGKLQDATYATEGLYFSIPIFRHCFELPEGSALGKAFSNMINVILHGLQKPVTDSVDLLSQAINELRNYAYKPGIDRGYRPNKNVDVELDLRDYEPNTTMNYQAFIHNHGLKGHRPDWTPRAILYDKKWCETTLWLARMTGSEEEPCDTIIHADPGFWNETFKQNQMKEWNQMLTDTTNSLVQAKPPGSDSTAQNERKPSPGESCLLGGPCA